MNEPELSIVIPAFNEAKRLPLSLDRISNYLRDRYPDAEVIVVDDGSTDATAQVVKDRARSWPQLRLVSPARNGGKGSAVRLGMAAATGRYRVFTDADLSVPIDDMEKLLTPLRNGAAVAFASRAVRGADVQLHQPWYREGIGKAYNLVVQLVALRGVHDSQCGFKAFTAEAAGRVFPPLQTTGFSFDVEVLYRARKAGFKLEEVPTRWINSPQTKVSTLKGLQAFLEILAIPGRVKKHPQ
jgi:dolichyl-phosphate beta-glucosyltransferase